MQYMVSPRSPEHHLSVTFLTPSRCFLKCHSQPSDGTIYVDVKTYRDNIKTYRSEGNFL